MQANERQAVDRSFPFLSLPPELRYMVYREIAIHRFHYIVPPLPVHLRSAPPTPASVASTKSGLVRGMVEGMVGRLGHISASILSARRAFFAVLFPWRLRRFEVVPDLERGTVDTKANASTSRRQTRKTIMFPWQLRRHLRAQYKAATDHHAGNTSSDGPQPGSVTLVRMGLPTQVLLACKQIHDEAKHILEGKVGELEDRYHLNPDIPRMIVHGYPFRMFERNMRYTEISFALFQWVNCLITTPPGRFRDFSRFLEIRGHVCTDLHPEYTEAVEKWIYLSGLEMAAVAPDLGPYLAIKADISRCPLAPRAVRPMARWSTNIHTIQQSIPIVKDVLTSKLPRGVYINQVVYGREAKDDAFRMLVTGGIRQQGFQAANGTWDVLNNAAWATGWEEGDEDLDTPHFHFDDDEDEQ